jgi:adenine-specific DNA-methyltransferase
MDGVFGRENRVATVTIVRSASTGHKARNAGPVNVADYLLIYAKEKRRWRSFPQERVRRDYDFAYMTYLENREEDCAKWRFVPIGKLVCKELGYKAMQAATRALGRDEAERAIARFAMKNYANVVRFAQPRYEAVSTEARAWIDRSKLDPTRVYCLKRPRFKEMFLRGGNRILFLSDKVRVIDDRPVLVEPLTSVWDDVPFQGIAREGGVVFSRNKKPERLLARILAMSTSPGDWVLDPFLGSGTTAAVAQKMGRRWVGIEEGGHVDDLCLPRLRRVVGGMDPTGITKVQGWCGGGSFGVYA